MSLCRVRHTSTETKCMSLNCSLFALVTACSIEWRRLRDSFWSCEPQLNANNLSLAPQMSQRLRLRLCLVLFLRPRQGPKPCPFTGCFRSSEFPTSCRREGLAVNIGISNSCAKSVRTLPQFCTELHGIRCTDGFECALAGSLVFRSSVL